MYEIYGPSCKKGPWVRGIPPSEALRDDDAPEMIVGVRTAATADGSAPAVRAFELR